MRVAARRLNGASGMPPATERRKVLAAGVLSIVLMLGVARFAYTPLLPLMQQQAGLGVNQAGGSPRSIMSAI
jgi:hypothetical protein